MKQNTILLILFGVILIYYLCKSSREGAENQEEVANPEAATMAAATMAAATMASNTANPTNEGNPAMAPNKVELGPELLKRIKELESTITKLKFQTKRARLQGQNIVAVDKLDLGKLSMDLFNWNKLNKKSNVDVNLILGDHIKQSAKETTVKHIIPSGKKEKSCDPVADEKEQQPPPVKYKGYPVFTKPEFPRTQKFELPKGAKGGQQMNIPIEKSDVNTETIKAYNTESYDQRADTGIEKSH